MRVIDKLAWIHIKDGRMLSARSRGKNVYFIPGGKHEAGESDEEAPHGHPDGVVVRMTSYTGEYVGQLQPAAEIEEMAWLTHADRNRLSLVAQIIVDSLRDQRMLQ